MSAELERKLDLLIALQRVAHREELEALRETLLQDKVSREILRATGDSIDAGALKKQVMRRASASKPTVERRIAELVGLGAIQRSGSGAHVQYVNAGLISA